MKTEKKIYFPLFASRQLNGGFQSAEEGKAVWQAIQAISDEKRNILLSQNVAEATAILDEKFRLPEKFVEYITVLVRELFFGNLTEQDILRALRQELTKIPNAPADAIIQHVQLNIFKALPDPEEPDEEENTVTNPVPQEDMKQYILLDALSKYPNLGNQQITTENIKLKSQVAPVRPSLTNWLKNYRDEIGIGTHDAVTRAQFLFESLNTKKLTSWERDRIHALLRSIEDNELLNINTVKQELVFLHEVKDTETTAHDDTTSASEATPDLFERFQNVNMSVASPVELTNVGTKTFGGGKVTPEKKSGEEQGVLARINSMAINPPQANAPAPREDFQVEVPEKAQAMAVNEPMGTLRFSAKHVLPAERQSISASALPVSPSRLEHFQPVAVAITEEPLKRESQNQSPRPPATAERVLQPTVAPVAPIPGPAPTAQSQPYSAPNMFRIKPTRDAIL